jgi:hypothetical protein
MKLVAFGDSFTAGDWETINHRDVSYVARLCEITDSIFGTWDNHARGGYSNIQIAFSVYKYLQENKNSLEDKFFLIGWTSYARYSTANVRHEDSRRHYAPHDAYEFTSKPSQYPLSTNLLIYETDMAILAINTLLQRMNVPFAMIQAFDEHTNHPWATTKDMPNWINGARKSNTLMHIIAQHYLDESFDPLPPNSQHFEFNWISKIAPNPYMASCWHPNELGHRLISDTLYPYLAKQCENL